MQSKLGSFIEALANTASGFMLALIVQKCYFNIAGIHTTFKQDFYLVVVMTIVSIGRSYVIRRLWNRGWWRDPAMVWCVILFFAWMVILCSMIYGVL